MADTRWEYRIDQMVRQNIGYWWQIYAQPGGPELSEVDAGSKAYLHFGIQNKGSEVHFEEVEVRLVPFELQGQPVLSFLDDTGNQIGRTNLKFTGLGSGEIQRSGSYFVAKTKLVKYLPGFDQVLMDVGVYAVVRPEGHAWRKEAW